MKCNHDKPVVLGFGGNASAAALAHQLGCRFETAELHRFPDGESRLRIPELRCGSVIIFRSLDRPNDKLVELLLCVRHLRNCGIATIVLAAPYLCYMRQDAAFTAGEVVSQRWIGSWLATLIDGLVTVDPHLHRVHRLRDVVPGSCCETVSAAPLAGELARQSFSDPVLIGPDAESAQWLQQAACGSPPLDQLVARKTRSGDCQVRLQLPEFRLRNRDVVLIDDIASTGATLVECARLARDRGARNVTAIVTHALFDDGAIPVGRSQLLSDIWSTDSVPHPSNRIHLAVPVAAACSSVLEAIHRKRRAAASPC
ncbi:MAG: ribose-phosphate diphosphokinase [Chromatiales bacterium]|jgi:ribose-phosphate pyrophosphokinase